MSASRKSEPRPTVDPGPETLSTFPQALALKISVNVTCCAAEEVRSRIATRRTTRERSGGLTIE